MSEDQSVNLKNQLRLYMQAKGLTAAQLSRMSGVPKQSLSDWLAGRQPRNLGHLKKVARCLETTIDNLLFGKGQDPQSKSVTELEALLGDQWVSGLFEVKFRRVKRRRE